MTSPVDALIRRLQQNPTDTAALDGVQEQLTARRDFAKLEQILGWLSKALRDRRAEPGLTADVHRRLGTVRRENLGDLEGAIAAFEGALAARPDDLSAMHELANLFVTRGRASGADADFARAAQLYHGVASRVPAARAISYAEAALDCDAAAAEPLELLERLYELPRDRDKLMTRWEQFIAKAPDGPAMDRRRTRLAREYTLDRRLEDALACLEPLAAKGMEKAQQAVTHLRKKLGRRAPPPAQLYRPKPMEAEEEAKTTLRQGPGEALLMAPPGSPPKGLYGSAPFEAPVVEYADADRTDPMGAPADAEVGGPPLLDPLLIEDHPEIELEMETTTDKVAVARPGGDVPFFPDDRGKPATPASQPPPRRASAQPPAPRSGPPPGSSTEPPAPLRRVAVQVVLPRDGVEPVLYTDEEDEAEESGRAELEYVEPFPVDTILADREVRASHSRSRKTAPVLEVVRLSGGRIVGSDVLRWPGQGIRPRRAPFSVRRGVTGATLKIRSTSEGGIWRAGAAPDTPAEPLPPPGKVRLGIDDVAEVSQGAVRWRLRMLRPPIKPIGKGWWRDLPWKVFLACAGLAAFEHLLLIGIFLGLATLGVSFKVEDRPQEEVFAEVRLRQREPRAEVIRPPRPIRRRRQVRENEPPEPAEEQVRIPRSLRTKLRQIARTRTDGDSANRLVNALRSPVQGEGQSISEVTSNIEAVEGGGQSGAFRVGGTLAALEGTGVNIASGGGGDIGTVGEQTTKNLDRMQAGSGRVRGRVRGVQALARVQGSLSRGEVLAVLNRAIGRIQRCYERSLTANPNLSGRIAFSWTIRPNGSVGGVRETSSTLGNPAVSTCISRVIRGLRFPRPQGGPVEVSFPFMFQRVQ